MGIVAGPVRDWVKACDVIRESWKHNRQTTFDYTPDYVSSLFEYPGGGPALAPAYYEGGELIAFVVGFPRSVLLEGQVRKLLLMSFFTVAPGYQGQGYGRRIWAECLAQAKNAGYHGILHYCVDGNPSNAITMAGARAAGFEAQHVFTVRHMMRLLRPAADPQPEVEAVDPTLFQAAAESLVGLPLARLWSATEAQYQMQRPPGRVCCADTAGGVLTGYVLHAADETHRPSLFIEDILWGRLEPESRGGLLSRFMSHASKIASLVIVPLLEYADMSPFIAAGFRRSPRLLHAYLTLLEESPSPGALGEFSGMYVDVL
jgi:GNAT superfamily N-acetyltransferase